MSLHTKYRPTSFAGVIGQGHIIPSLQKVVKDNRAKTFLFTGPSGTGKTTLARIMANQFAGGQATAANLEEHDAASKSGADDVRDLVSRTMYRAIGVCPNKSIILDEAHRLSGAAWTVLLKPIEEPPAHVYWLLCTTEYGKIPKTIQTRCLRYELKPVSEEQIYELLEKVRDHERLDVQDDILECVAEAALGSPRQSLVFLEACAHCSSTNEAKAVMRSAAQSGDAVALARLLLRPQGRSWAETVKLVKALDGVADAESIRIAIINYLAAVLINTSGNDKARAIMGLMEPFMQPFNNSDRMAPLLYALGLALNLDQPQ